VVVCLPARLSVHLPVSLSDTRRYCTENVVEILLFRSHFTVSGRMGIGMKLLGKMRIGKLGNGNGMVWYGNEIIRMERSED